MAAKEELNEEQKVAILLASMNEKVAASVLQQLEPETMGRVADAIRSLGVVSGDVRDSAISDCVRGIVDMSDSVQGNDKTVNSLLSKAIGEKRASALLADKDAVQQAAAFACVQKAPNDQIVTVLSGEQPSVIAVVLKHLPAEKAANVLALLESEVRRRVIVLMCTAESPSPEIIEQIDAFLQTRIRAPKEQKKVKELDKLDAVTNILQNIDKSVEEELLSAVDETSEALGSELRDRLFTFEDVVNLSDVAMRRILQEVDMGLLGISLRGASIDVREKFFGNMSKRAAEGLKEEMEFSQKVKMSDVQEKQKEIVNIIRSLEADGQITVGEGGSDEYV